MFPVDPARDWSAGAHHLSGSWHQNGCLHVVEYTGHGVSPLAEEASSPDGATDRGRSSCPNQASHGSICYASATRVRSNDLWVITGLCVWIGSLLFAAFGLFTGYLLPSENVTQLIALALTLCSFAGGLFIPVSQFSPGLMTFAKLTPLYGLNQLVHYPLAGGTLQWGWILNLVVWLAIFVAGATWRLRRDTARV
jgi:hypothetical protein